MSAVPSWITPELVQATIEAWQPFYADPITPEDAAAILKGLGALLSVLSGRADRHTSN